MARFKDTDKLIEYWDPRLQKAFLGSIRNVRDSAQVEQLARAIASGDSSAAIKAAGIDPINFRPLDKTLTEAFEAGGNATASRFPMIGNPGELKTKFQFNVRNPAAEIWLRENSSTLISDITNDQQDLIRSAMQKGLARGDNPRTVALDLVGRIGPSGSREGGLIGLTTTQTEWVDAYAEEIATDPINTIPHVNELGIKVPGRTLRDKRFDRAVNQSVESGEPIPDDIQESMVTSYKNQALFYRAEAIARTEAMASLHEAQQQAMEQAVEGGLVKAENVTFIWRTAHDKRVRDSHRVMDGQEVALGQMFETGDGNFLEYPGDPNGPAEEVINCRCWREPNVDFLAGVE